MEWWSFRKRVSADCWRMVVNVWNRFTWNHLFSRCALWVMRRVVWHSFAKMSTTVSSLQIQRLIQVGCLCQGERKMISFSPFRRTKHIYGVPLTNAISWLFGSFMHFKMIISRYAISYLYSQCLLLFMLLIQLTTIYGTHYFLWFFPIFLSISIFTGMHNNDKNEYQLK